MQYALKHLCQVEMNTNAMWCVGSKVFSWYVVVSVEDLAACMSSWAMEDSIPSSHQPGGL